MRGDESRRCPPSIPHSQLCFLGLPCFRGRPRRPKGIKALAAFIFCDSSIGGGGCSEMYFLNSSQWAFLKLKAGFECWCGDWEQVGDWCLWRVSDPRPGRVRHSHVGAKWDGTSETSGEEREPKEWWSSVWMSGSLRMSSCEVVTVGVVFAVVDITV